MDYITPMPIVYKFILDTSKCKVMTKHKSDFFFPLRFLQKSVTCTSFHAIGMPVKVPYSK